ncbi:MULTISPECIES: hypothetical protein [Pseudomonas]|uniref:hypothetical protein n=1 Tax=Pseudomonas TaxID=286 RepID=UPI002DB97E0E|nr:hypothetical protein [Pseudomonas asiatica]MEB6587551.1 hypothetical protein [Pseudomonas asiatica]
MQKEERVQALHYCTQAIEQLEVGMRMVRKDMPGILHAHRVLVKLLRESVKFILPNCAELVDMSEVRQAHLDLARLPFPVVALESPWVFVGNEGEDKPGCHRSTRRIALCVTMGPELAELLPDTERFLKEEHGGVVVFSLYWNDATSRWVLPMGGLFVPHQNEVAAYVPEEATLLDHLANGWLLEADPTHTKQRKFNISPTVLMPEKFGHYSEVLGFEQAVACIIRETHEEVMAFLQASVMLNCANVRMADIAAPSLLNKKRKAKGKTPFFNYRVLQVEAPRSGSASMGGHHASPRGHLRRGHIRRLPDRMVWVRPAFVNVSATGEMINKDYAIRPSQEGK